MDSQRSDDRLTSLFVSLVAAAVTSLTGTSQDSDSVRGVAPAKRRAVPSLHVQGDRAAALAGNEADPDQAVLAVREHHAGAGQVRALVVAAAASAGASPPGYVIRPTTPWRGIPPGSVATPSNMSNILGRLASLSGRRAPGSIQRITCPGGLAVV